MFPKLPASAEIDESSEIKVLDIHELMRGRASFRQAESSHGEIETPANLHTLLSRVSKASTHEIDNLIDELQIIRAKLRDDANRIQRDIGDYAALSEQVMQLTGIISESLQKLPNASSTRE